MMEVQNLKKRGATIKIPRLRLPSAQGTAMVLVTGQARHMWGPEAFSVSVYGQVSSGVNTAISGGFIMSLNSKQGFSRIYGTELGLGTVNAGGGIVYTEYYCACSEDKVSIGLFLGKGWSVNGQLDDVVKLGFGVSYSNENDFKAKTYGLSVSYGLDAVTTGIDINFNRTMSADKFMKLKAIFQK
jgi:hypothetical protein